MRGGGAADSFVRVRGAALSPRGSPRRCASGQPLCDGGGVRGGGRPGFRGVGGPHARVAGSHLAGPGVPVGLGGPGLAGRPFPAAAALAAGELARHPAGLAALREHRHQPLLPARCWRTEWRNSRWLFTFFYLGERKQHKYKNTPRVTAEVTEQAPAAPGA